mgnify:CR=1 FL=1
MPFALFPQTETPVAHRTLFGQRDGGIDLRNEMHTFLYGDSRQRGHGYWVVFRKFDRTRYAEGYNSATGQGVFFPPTGEGIGGPIYPYTDTAIRIASEELSTANPRLRGEQRLPIGAVPFGYRVFFMEHTTQPTEADRLYELDNYVSEKAPASIAGPFPIAWDIQTVAPLREDGGRIEYYSIVAVKTVPRSQNR